ncbi:hypothetical protein, partial [Roseiflexus sp.]|uniref:hypothetical protein n=1 Tax=Roseiflexus sp. TaxID=2562120 RepID=UPI00398A5524
GSQRSGRRQCPEQIPMAWVQPLVRVVPAISPQRKDILWKRFGTPTTELTDGCGDAVRRLPPVHPHRTDRWVRRRGSTVAAGAPPPN